MKPLSDDCGRTGWAIVNAGEPLLNVVTLCGASLATQQTSSKDFSRNDFSSTSCGDPIQMTTNTPEDSGQRVLDNNKHEQNTTGWNHTKSLTTTLSTRYHGAGYSKNHRTRLVGFTLESEIHSTPLEVIRKARSYVRVVTVTLVTWLGSSRNIVVSIPNCAQLSRVAARQRVANSADQLAVIW